jgi:transposase InsO family protein
VSRCWFVDDHRHLYEVKRLCRLVELNRSTYYAWRNPALSDRYLDDAWLTNEIFDIFAASRGTYGRPRVHGQLHNAGRRVGAKRVARLMAEAGWVGTHGRKRWRSRRSCGRSPGEDLLRRDFTATGPDERWVADISEFACRDGKLFLAGIWDLFDHSIVGWSMGERQTTDLVIAALVMGLGRRDPADELIHHADHGTQYRAIEFSNRLTDWGLTASYGSVGDCFDNSAMEGVWSRLKTEIIDIHDRPLNSFTRSELRTVLFDYIEVFYNRQRHQARLGHRTPAEVYAATRAA